MLETDALPALRFVFCAFLTSKGDEDGPLFIALDGNFRLFRYKSASKVDFCARFQRFIAERLNLSVSFSQLYNFIDSNQFCYT
jgi:hypothetical protein